MFLFIRGSITVYIIFLQVTDGSLANGVMFYPT